MVGGLMLYLSISLIWLTRGSAGAAGIRCSMRIPAMEFNPPRCTRRISKKRRIQGETFHTKDEYIWLGLGVHTLRGWCGSLTRDGSV